MSRDVVVFGTLRSWPVGRECAFPSPLSLEGLPDPPRYQFDPDQNLDVGSEGLQ